MFIFAANAKYVGGFTTDAMQILVVTSLFAAFLAFHCNTARYHLALSCDGLLPRALSRTHPRYGSPVAVSAAQLGLLAAVVIGFTLAHQNPYLGMGTSLYGLGVLGIVALIRRGRPPAHRGSSAASPLALNAWITSLDRVLIRGDQPGDRRHPGARRRRHDDHRPAHPHRPVLAAPHDLQQPPALLITQPPRPHPLSHHNSWPSISSP
jgi:hypothetical protein